MCPDEILTLDNISWITDPTYNALGQVSSITYPSGKSVSYAPNALGQATRAGNYATAASYTPNGQLKGFTYGNGLTFTQTLDSQQRPEYQTVKRSNTNVLSHRYQYDANHNIDTITDLVTPAKNISLSYDSLDRLATAAGFWGNGSFSYDALGNITQKTLGSQSLNYSYNTSNRLTGITGSQSRSYSYDSRGNITNNGQRAFSYNLANQLISSGTNSYQYDGYNRRVKKVSNGKTQYSLYNAAGKLLMTDGDNGPTEYFYLGNKLIAKESQVPTSEDTPGYTGHLEDDDLQLTYMQQRYYDPIAARFNSNDPVGFIPANPMMFNRYAYANNNPYAFNDPDGRNPRRLLMTALKDSAGMRSAWREVKRGLERTGIVPPPSPMRNESVPDDLADIPVGSEGKPSSSDYPANPDDWIPPEGWSETSAGEKTDGRHRQWKNEKDEIKRRWDSEGRHGGKERGSHWHDYDDETSGKKHIEPDEIKEEKK